MKSRFLPVLLLLFAPFFVKNLDAQTAFDVEIQGPTILCAGQCDTFYAVTFGSPVPPPPQDYYKWFVSGPGGYSANAMGEKFFFCTQLGQTSLGTYTFIVGAMDANGAFTAMDTLQVLVLPYLPLDIVSFNPAPCNTDSLSDPDNNACEKVCPNTTVTYSVQTSGNPGGTQTAITWQVTGANSFTVNPPFNTSVTVEWGGPGAGSVSVAVDDDINGFCSGEDAVCITIIAEPVAKFTADPPPSGGVIQVCKGQTVYFENQSTGADGHEWFFSDDFSTSFAIEPQHTFLTPGNYTIRLIARSECLCSDTTTLEVQVLDAEAPSLDCVGTICPGETVTYTASNACPPFAWSVTPNGTVLNGGTSTIDSITVQWNAGPKGVITLGAQPCSGNVCPNPATIHVPIISDDAEIRGDERVCPGAVEVYSIESYGGTGFNWTLSGGGTITEGQGTNSVTIEWTDFPNPSTTYWLTVEYDNCYLGCGGQDSLEIRVLSPFVINGPVELCEGTSGNFTSKLTFNAQNIASNWTLFTPDGSVAWTSAGASAAVSAPFANGDGVYRLFATPADPTQTCSDEADWAVNISSKPAKPTSISGEKNICANTTYTYSATGVLPSNNIQWTVQNGPGAPVVSFGNNINVTWGNTNPRWISVAQVSTNGLNCTSDTALLSISGIGLVFINGDQNVCENSKGNYSIISLQNVDILWEVTPATAGAVASGQGTNAVEIFWSEAGGHVVSLDVCGQTALIPVTVIAPPSPTVQYASSVCPGQTTAVQTTTAFAAYSWRNASGVEISTAPTVNLSNGSYYVEVEDFNGCPGATEFTVAEDPAPNLSITTADPTGFCNNSSFVTLTALTNADGNFTFQWFQNGTPVGSNTPTFTTNQYGSYSVQVTTAAGCTATAGSILLFNDCSGSGGGGGFPGAGFPSCPLGSVDFSINPTGICDSFHFQLIPSPQYLPGSAQWTFGISGGSVVGTSAVENPNFGFPNAGKYIAVLKVTLTDGSMCVVVDSVNVAASAQFKVVPDCPNQATVFQDVSTFLPGSGIASWQWNFGDPPSGGMNFSSLRNPTHTYSLSGNPVVTLTITANNGCTSTTSQTISIPSVSVALFTPPAFQCAGNALEFISNPGLDVSQIAWNFGDLASGAANDATGSPVYHNFTSPSNYAVTTTATNVYGCTATFTQILTVTPNGLNGNITPANPSPFCEGGSVTLTAPGGAVSYLWSDGTTTQTLVTTDEGTYSVTLTDANGCTYVPPSVNVEQIPSPDALIKALLENELGQIIGTSYPTLSTCEGENVHLIVQANGAYGFSWSGGNGFDNEIFFTDDRNNLLSIGNHVFTVTVTDFSTGCTSVTDPFVVTVNPVPSGFSIAANGFCAGDANVLTYNGPQPANWQFIWNNGVPGTTLATEEAGVYFIRVINEFGCEAKSNNLTVLPGPNVAAIPGGCHSRCRPDTLCLPLILNIVSWQWYFNGSPISGATNPDFVATQSGSYYAELTDIFGCTNQSDPLTLNLFEGFGNINGQVWSDVNGNGIIDAGDTLVSGISVNLLQNGAPVGTGQSAANGGFSFTNVLSTNYLVEIDTALLPNGWQVVVGQNAVALNGCNALGESDLLLRLCPPLSSSVQLTACANESADFNGTLVPAGTTQNFILAAQNGCDSTVIVSVAPIPISTATLLVNVCPNEVYSYNGTLILPGETKDFVFQNYLGCDSIVTVSVFQVEESASTLDVSICSDDFYDYNGTLLAAGATQEFHFQNQLGCDSTVTVNVGALPVSTSNLLVSACPGTTYDYNGTLLSPGQSQNFIFSNYLGCDSTVTVTVAESPTYYYVVDAVACQGDSLLFNGVNIPAGSSYIFNYQNSSGCDSIIEVAVGVLFPSAPTSLEVSACVGETYNYLGAQIAVGQTATFTLPNQVGCDSVVAVTVKGLPTSASSLEVRVCPGKTYDYQGFALSAGQVWNFTFDNWVGCDSVVTVTVLEYSIPHDTLAIEACPGATYLYNGTEIPTGEMADFYLVGPEGCDSIVTVVVTPLPEAIFDAQAENSCATSATGSLTVTGATGGLPPYVYSLDGTDFQDSTRFDDLAAGDYTVFLEDLNGCIFEIKANVPAFPRLEVGVPDGVLPCDNSGTQLEAFASGDTTGLKFTWLNGDTTSFTTVTEAGIVWVEATNHCETVRREASVNWADVPLGTNYLYVPNVIKPESSDPYNSEFKPFFQPNLEILSYRFEVFDRWGNKTFGTNQTDAGWNGTFRADELNPGVYVWYVKVKVVFCGRTRDLQFEGDVTVVR